MSEHVSLTADKLKLVKKALRCPAKLIQSDKEKTFLSETRERIEKFGERIYLSEKQLSWLEQIACRIDGGAKKSGEGGGKNEPTDEDLPSYDEMAGD